LMTKIHKVFFSGEKNKLDIRVLIVKNEKYEAVQKSECWTKKSTS